MSSKWPDMFSKTNWEAEMMRSLAAAMAKKRDENIRRTLLGTDISGCMFIEDPYLLGHSISGGYYGPGILPIAEAVQATIVCQYCDNLYPHGIIYKYHTCPTCGGDWPKEKK